MTRLVEVHLKKTQVWPRRSPLPAAVLPKMAVMTGAGEAAFDRLHQAAQVGHSAPPAMQVPGQNPARAMSTPKTAPPNRFPARTVAETAVRSTTPKNLRV